MREVTPEDVKIRHFLLDGLEEAEREQLEELFLTDSGFREQVLLAENELIEDYLEDDLDQAEAKKFRQVFETTPTLVEKLRIAQSIRNHAKNEYAATSVTRRKAYVYPAIAAALLAILFGGLWLMRRAQLEQRAAQEKARIAAIEKELITANIAATGSVESPEPKVSPLVLPSVSKRGLGPESTLGLSSGADAFDLWLLPTVTQYNTYNATLKKLSTTDQFHVPGLELQNGKQGKMIRLRVPARILTHSVYEIVLDAVAPNGQVVNADKFTFQVTN
jgi:hypothetical protein